MGRETSAGVKESDHMTGIYPALNAWSSPLIHSLNGASACKQYCRTTVHRPLDCRLACKREEVVYINMVMTSRSMSTLSAIHKVDVVDRWSIGAEHQSRRAGPRMGKSMC